MADLFATLDRMSIEPDSSERVAAQFTLHVTAGARGPDRAQEDPEQPVVGSSRGRNPSDAIAIGDHVVIQHLDDRKHLAVTLTRTSA
jgi:hypothetical protein